MSNIYGASRSGFGDINRSGYGGSRYVDCNSALALLGFVLFVDILRDFLESVTSGAEEEEGGTRKKRWIRDEDPILGRISSSEELDILDFVNKDGSQHMYNSLPGILAPSLEGWWTLSSGYHKHCLQRSVCQVNFVLARDYGVAGRIVATLFSNVASHALPGEEDEMKLAALMADREGRRRNACEVIYPDCPNLPVGYQQHRYINNLFNNITDFTHYEELQLRTYEMDSNKESMKEEFNVDDEKLLDESSNDL